MNVQTRPMVVATVVEAGAVEEGKAVEAKVEVATSQVGLPAMVVVKKGTSRGNVQTVTSGYPRVKPIPETWLPRIIQVRDSSCTG